MMCKKRYWNFLWVHFLCVALFVGCDEPAETRVEGTEAGDCNDSADNDGDGRIDCFDEGCYGSPACPESDGDSDVDSDVDADSDVDSDSDADGDSENCVIAECEDNQAETCDGALSLNCENFGGVCWDFIDFEDNEFEWCDCGNLGSTMGLCMSDQEGVYCDEGIAVIAQCADGTVCFESSDYPEGLACACDDQDDGICPDAACTSDPDCKVCVPDCADRQCGSNGCRGSCGSCGLGYTCDESAGICERICIPDCDGRECGPDSCEGTCGPGCSGDETCNTTTGQCESEDPCGGACEAGKGCTTDSDGDGVCVNLSWFTFEIGIPAGSGSYTTPIFEESLENIGPDVLPPVTRPGVQCLYDDFFRSLTIYFADDDGNWQGTISVSGDPWLDILAADEIDDLSITIADLPDYTDGTYLWNSGVEITEWLAFNEVDVIEAKDPEGWGLLVFFQCVARREGGTEELHFSGDAYCGGFELP